tara:strand:+ start:825 stop:1079 length:255 start_codon:yes stop_codon:yes gene_type:complete
MSPKDKKELERLKTLNVRADVPKDLGVAIESFMQQAFIIGEYGLDYMPSEYMENLLRTLAKYPEHSMLFMGMIEILERENIIEN